MSNHAGRVRQRVAYRSDGRSFRPGNFSGEHAATLGQPIFDLAGDGPQKAGVYDAANVRLGTRALGLVPWRGKPGVGGAFKRIGENQFEAGHTVSTGEAGFCLPAKAASNTLSWIVFKKLRTVTS